MVKRQSSPSYSPPFAIKSFVFAQSPHIPCNNHHTRATTQSSGRTTSLSSSSRRALLPMLATTTTTPLPCWHPFAHCIADSKTADAVPFGGPDNAHKKTKQQDSPTKREPNRISPTPKTVHTAPAVHRAAVQSQLRRQWLPRWPRHPFPRGMRDLP